MLRHAGLALALVSITPTADAASVCRECVLRPLRARSYVVRRCYAELLDRRPGAEGRIVVVFVIPKDGTVRSVRIERDGFGDEPFRACVTRVFRGLRYPDPPPAPMTIHLPIVLTSR